MKINRSKYIFIPLALAAAFLQSCAHAPAPKKKMATMKVVPKKIVAKAPVKIIEGVKLNPLSLNQAETKDAEKKIINNKGLLELTAFSNGKTKLRKFETLSWKLAKDKSAPAIVADEVSVKSAGPKKEEVPDSSEDDIQVFEYSETKPVVEAEKIEKVPGTLIWVVEELPIENKYAEATLSKSVRDVIKRESAEDLILKRKKQLLERTPATEAAEDDEIESYDIADAVKEGSSSIKKEESKPEDFVKNAFVKQEEMEATKLTYTILAREVTVGKKTDGAFGFEFIPHYDRNDRTPDSSGEIHLEYSVTGNRNIVSGIVSKLGYMEVQTDLNLASTSMKTVVPLLKNEEFHTFLSKNNLSSNGSYILLNLTKGYQDVETDSEYGEKIFLTANFKVTAKIENATFLLITGLRTGNVFVKLKALDKWFQKIVNTQEEMITYIDEEMDEGVNFDFELFQESKSGKLNELSLEEDAVKLFASKNPVRKISLNKISVKLEDSMSTQKNYLETKNGSKSFVSINPTRREIVVPTEREKQTIMKEFQVQSLENSCVIQVNTDQDMLGIKLGGPADQGEVFTQLLFQDRDGNISNEVTEWTNKVYILGDRAGILNIQIEYQSGARAITNSYCNSDTYVVENL